MQRITILLFLLVVCLATAMQAQTPAHEEDDKKAVENVVRGLEKAVQEFDFDKADSLLTPDARWIEASYPHPVEPDFRLTFQLFKDAKIRIDYHPHDVEVNVRGDVAWATVTLDSVWNADTEAARAWQGGKSERRVTYVESEILVRTPNGWKIALGQTTRLTPYFGTHPDIGQEHGGMKFAVVRDGSPAGKAGFKAGDVMIEFGGQKIDNPHDFFFAVLPAHNIGDKVMVTVMRGQEKIAKEVTLEGKK